MYDVFEELNKLYESKADQALFINKFGQERFDRFNKLKSKIANVKDDSGKSISTDIVYHTKHTSEKDLDLLLDRAENKQYAVGDTIEYDIEGKKIPKPANTKKLIKSTANYNIYKVTDYRDAIDLALQKIDPKEDAYGYWCIAGRYQLTADNEVKVSQAKEFFYRYLNEEYEAYYFCMPKDHAIHKIVICALLDQEDSYTAFSAEDSPLSEEAIPAECLSFIDQETGFTPSYCMTDEEFDEEVEDEYDNMQSYFEDVPNDPTRLWLQQIEDNFKSFYIDFSATRHTWDAHCNVLIYLKDEYFDRSSIIVQLEWYVPEQNVLGTPVDTFTSTIMYPPDMEEEELYTNSKGAPTADEFEAELSRLYNVLQNIDLISQSVNTINEYAVKTNSQLDIEPIIDGKQVHTLIAYDIPIDNTELSKDAFIAITVNIGFDTVEEMFKSADQANAYASCYSYAVLPEFSEDISDTAVEGAEYVPAVKLQELIKDQIEYTMKEITVYKQNRN